MLEKYLKLKKVQKKRIQILKKVTQNLLKDNLIGYYSIDSSLVKIVERESISY